MNWHDKLHLITSSGTLLAARVVDFLVVAFVVYQLILLVQKSRALQIVGGLGVFILALILSDKLGLSTLHWVLDRGSTLGPVALVILLYPELRMVLERFGRLGFLGQSYGLSGSDQQIKIVEEVVSAVMDMASQRIGAILVFERMTRLDTIVENGVTVNALLSKQLLLAIFYPGNPLHDGAVIVRADHIVAAACQLPMSEIQLDPALHMRHRAALGMSEQSDALCIVVSEERGQVSGMASGVLRKGMTTEQLRELLLQMYRKPGSELAPLLRLRRQVDRAVAKVKHRSEVDA